MEPRHGTPERDLRRVPEAVVARCGSPKAGAAWADVETGARAALAIRASGKVKAPAMARPAWEAALPTEEAAKQRAGAGARGNTEPSARHSTAAARST